jgi:predicted transposase YbfD/YdcC
VKPASLSDHLESLPDPRAERNRKHPLVDVVAIAVCGVLVGCDGPTAIRLRAEPREGRLRGFLTRPAGLPSQDCLRRVLSWLKPDAFAKRFAGRIAECVTAHGEGRLVSIDGKPLRRSRDKQHSLGALHVVSERDGKETSEVRYHLSRPPPGVRRFAAAVRSHWTIENALHWVLGVTFREDESRSRDRLLAQNLAALHRLAIGLLKQHSAKHRLRGKQRIAGWNTDFRAQVLTPHTTYYGRWPCAQVDQRSIRATRMLPKSSRSLYLADPVTH